MITLALPVWVPCLETCLRKVRWSIGHPDRMTLVVGGSVFFKFVSTLTGIFRPRSDSDPVKPFLHAGLGWE